MIGKREKCNAKVTLHLECNISKNPIDIRIHISRNAMVIFLLNKTNNNDHETVHASTFPCMLVYGHNIIINPFALLYIVMQKYIIIKA